MLVNLHFFHFRNDLSLLQLSLFRFLIYYSLFILIKNYFNKIIYLLLIFLSDGICLISYQLILSLMFKFETNCSSILYLLWLIISEYNLFTELPTHTNLSFKATSLFQTNYHIFISGCHIKCRQNTIKKGLSGNLWNPCFP